MRPVLTSVILMALVLPAAAQDQSWYVRLLAAVKTAEGQCRPEGYSVEVRRAEELVAMWVPRLQWERQLRPFFDAEQERAFNVQREAYCEDVAGRYPGWVRR